MKDEFSSQMAKFEARLKAVETSTQRTSRTTRTETDKINDAYRKVAAALDPVVARTQRYEKQVETLNRALKAGIITQGQYNAQIAKAQAPLQSATHWTERLGSSVGRELLGNFTRFFAISALITGTIGSIVSVSRQLVQANLDAEASSRRVEEAVRRYGSTSGVSVEQIDSLAQSISRLTGIDDELIADAETLALRFNRIHAEVFPRVTQAAVDMSVATGTDLSAAFEKVGKLVNQPLRALTLLAREGYAVSKSQSDMIKSLVAAGDIEKAQIEILKILEAQYGGAAAAARDTMGGALKALSTTWENFLEKVGQDNMGPLRQALESLIKLLEIATDKVDEFTLGWHALNIGVNLFVGSATTGIAQVIDQVSSVAPLFGAWGLAIAKLNKEFELSGRFRSAAAAAGMNIAKSEAIIQKILAGTAGAHKSAAGAALEQTEAESKLNKQLKDLQSQTDETIAGLMRAARNTVSLYVAAVKGSREYNAEILRQKITEKILAEENKLRAAGIKLTEGQKFAIEQSIRTESQYQEFIKRTIELQRIAIEQTDNLARKGFAEHFNRELSKVQDGMRKIQVEVDKMLRALDMKRSLGNELEFQLRISGIDEVEPRLRQIEEDYISFLRDLGEGSVTEGERVFQLMAERFGWTVDQIKDKLSLLADIDIAAQLKADIASPDTSLKRLRETLERLKKTVDAGGRSLLTAAEAQEIYTRALSEHIASTLDAVSGFISQLGDITQSSKLQNFGRFVGDVSSVVSASQAFSNNASWSTMLGAAGAWLGAFVTIAEMFTDKGGVHFGAEIGSSGGSAVVSDQWTFVRGQIDEARKAGKAIANAINEIVSSLGAQLDSLVNFVIEQKGEGWAVTFVGGMRRYFDDFQDAVAFGVSQALADSDLSNISEEIRKALQENVFDTLEELNEFITFARDYSRIGLSDLTINLMDLTSWLIEGARKANEYGLSISKLSDEFGKQVNSLRDKILGIVRSPKEQLHQNVVDFNNWITQQRLSAQIQIDAARAQMDAAKLQMDAAFANIKGTGKDKDPELVRLFQEAQKIWKDAANRLDLWTKALDNLPPLITPEEEAEAGRRTRGTGGRGGGRQDVRDFIADRRFQLDLSGMSEWQRKLAELDKQYGPLIEQAGKDKKLREELLKLKERELDLLKKEQALSTVERFREFLGLITPFESVRKTAEGLIKDIEDSPFGSERKARMIGRVLAEIDRQLQAMSDEMSAGLLGDLAGMLDDGILKTDILRAQFVLNWQLQLADARARMAMLIAEGRLTDANRKLIEDAINTLAGLDPATLFGERGAGGTGEEGTASGLAYTSKMEKRAEAAQKAAEELSKALEDARNKLRKYTDDGVDPLTSKLIEIRDDFSQIRSVLGDTPEILDTFNKSVKRAVDEFIADIREFREGMDLSSLSTLTGEGQFYEAQSKFRLVKDAILAGDFSKIGELTGLAQQYGELGQRFTGGEGLRFIMKEIKDSLLAVETSTMGYAERFTGANLGTSTNPMMVSESPAMLRAVNDTTAAINNGNVLVLSELRESKAEIQAQTGLLYQVNQSLKPTGTGIA